jgi:hypothetical protein
MTNVYAGPATGEDRNQGWWHAMQIAICLIIGLLSVLQIYGGYWLVFAIMSKGYAGKPITQEEIEAGLILGTILVIGCELLLAPLHLILLKVRGALRLRALMVAVTATIPFLDIGAALLDQSLVGSLPIIALSLLPFWLSAAYSYKVYCSARQER